MENLEKAKQYDLLHQQNNRSRCVKNTTGAQELAAGYTIGKDVYCACSLRKGYYEHTTL